MSRALRAAAVAGIAVAVSLVSACGTWRKCGSETTVLVVRHADRLPGQKSDELSTAGHARSQELARVLKDAGVSAIIHSDTVRAAQTAAPLATASRIAPIVLGAKDYETIAGEVRRHPGETVLVVGHSNTVPAIIAALGGPARPDLGENEFGDLFVLTLSGCGDRPTRLLSLKYGEGSS